MAEAAAIGVEASDKILTGIVHYHISTNTRRNHRKFSLFVASLTGIIEDLARTLELSLLERHR